MCLPPAPASRYELTHSESDVLPAFELISDLQAGESGSLSEAGSLSSTFESGSCCLSYNYGYPAVEMVTLIDNLEWTLTLPDDNDDSDSFTFALQATNAETATLLPLSFGLAVSVVYEGGPSSSANENALAVDISLDAFSMSYEVVNELEIAWSETTVALSHEASYIIPAFELEAATSSDASR